MLLEVQVAGEDVSAVSDARDGMFSVEAGDVGRWLVLRDGT